MVSDTTLLPEEKLKKPLSAYNTVPEYNSLRKTSEAFGVRWETLRNRV
jgi:hypothetical protein